LSASALLGITAGFVPAVVVGFTGLAAAVVVLLVRPDFATLAAVGLLYSNAVVIAVRLHGAPSLAALIVPGLLVVPLLALVAAGASFELPPAFGWLAAFTVVQLASAAASIDQGRALSDIRTFGVECVAVYVLLYNVVRSRRQLRMLVALVILVVYLFLQDWRATLIPLLAVPVSLVGTFALFPLFVSQRFDRIQVGRFECRIS